MAAILTAIIAEGDKTAIPGPLTPDDALNWFITGHDCRGCTVALADGRVLGFQALDDHYLKLPGWADIGTFLAAAARGQGLGRVLWQVTQARARNAGIASLRAVIRRSNTDAQAYYRRCGFAEGVALPATVTGVPSDRVVLFQPAI